MASDLDAEQNTPDAAPRTGAMALAPGLIVVAVALLAAELISSRIDGLSTLIAALVIGIAIGNTSLTPASTRPGLRFGAKRLLRVGVVLLGLRLSLGEVLDLGPAVLIVVISTVVATFFGVQFIGRRMGLSEDISLLVATGFSICGLSAIAAVEDLTDASEDEVATSMVLVTICGTLAIFVLPVASNALGLSDFQTGLWTGASVHDTAQVVAAAGPGGAAVLSTAIAVKLARVMLLAPVVAGVTARRSRRARRDTAAGSMSLTSIMPMFVAGFIVAMVIRTLGILSDGTLDLAKQIEGLLLAAAMVGLGAGVQLKQIRRLGLRPLALGAAAWLLVASTSLLGVAIAS